LNLSQHSDAYNILRYEETLIKRTCKIQSYVAKLEKLIQACQNNDSLRPIAEASTKLLDNMRAVLEVLAIIPSQFPYMRLYGLQEQSELEQLSKERSLAQRLYNQEDIYSNLKSLVEHRVRITGTRYPYDQYFNTWLPRWLNIYASALEKVRGLQTPYMIQNELISQAEQTYKALRELKNYAAVCQELKTEEWGKKRDAELAQNRTALQNLQRDFNRLQVQHKETNNHLSSLARTNTNLQHNHRTLQNAVTSPAVRAIELSAAPSIILPAMPAFKPPTAPILPAPQPPASAYQPWSEYKSVLPPATPPVATPVAPPPTWSAVD